MALENYGAASKWAARELGGIFQPKETEIAVGTTAVLAVPSDNNRIGFVLTNDGVSNITLSADPAIVSGTGLLLLGNGSRLAMNYRDDLDGVAGLFYAISDLAGGSLHLFELVQAFSGTGEEVE